MENRDLFTMRELGDRDLEQFNSLLKYAFQVTSDEMLKTGFLCCFGIPLDLGCFFFNLIAIKIIKMCLSRSQFCELQISNIINISGIFQDCRKDNILPEKM